MAVAIDEQIRELLSEDLAAVTNINDGITAPEGVQRYDQNQYR